MLNTLKKQKLNYETIYKRITILCNSNPNYITIM